MAASKFLHLSSFLTEFFLTKCRRKTTIRHVDQNPVKQSGNDYQNQTDQHLCVQHVYEIAFLRNLFYPQHNLVLVIYVLCYSRKDLKRQSGFNPITFTFSENSNYGRESLLKV